MATLQHPALPSLDDLQVPRVVDIQVLPTEAERAFRIAYFEEHHAELMASHPGQFVAVCIATGEVLAADKDLLDLVGKLENAHVRLPFDAWIEFIGDDRPSYIL